MKKKKERKENHFYMIAALLATCNIFGKRNNS